MAVDTIIHIGDIGTTFQLTVIETDGTVVDISAATVMRMYFKKPDGERACREAEFKTDGEDGILDYVTVEDDIDQTGQWQLQGYVEIAEDAKFYTEKVTFSVQSNLYVECEEESL